MNQATQFIKENKMNLPIDFNQVIIGGSSAGAQSLANLRRYKRRMIA